METTNVICVKEDRETLKKIWDNIVRSGVAIQQAKIKNAPATLKIASVFAPEAAPILTSLSSFLKTDTGKSLTEISVKNYDIIGDILTGNKTEAKQKFNENLKILSGDEALKMIKETSEYVNKTGGRHI